MPYAIETKDGITIGNIPDDMPDDDPSIKQKVESIRQMRQEVDTPQDINQGMGTVDTLRTSAGRGLNTIGRAVGLAEPEAPAVTQQFKQLQEQQPIASTVGEIAGEAAPFLAAIPLAGAGLATAGGTSIIPAITSTFGRIAATAGLGALEGGLIARGKGADTGEQAGAAGLGGIAAGTMELVLPKLGRIIRKIGRRVLGRDLTKPAIDAAGNLSDEAAEALQKSGSSIDDVMKEARAELADEFVEPDQVARKAFLEGQGLSPTKAQITRDAADFQAQQEATKTSGRVREAIEGQESVLTSRFNNAVIDTGGDAVTPTSTVTDALVDKATVLDKEIGNLYKTAREAAPGEKNIRFNSLTNKLKALAPSNRRTGGNIEAIVGDLQSKGILDGDMKITGKVDVETAEDVRKLMNELYDPQNPFGNGVLRELKDTLDDDVFSASGGDVFKAGRKAKRDFEKGLTRAKISKFDSRKSNVVRDVLENKIDPDRFSEQVVMGKKYRASDLQQLKDYITDSPQGAKAFDDLRADVLETIKNRSFIGPEDAAGNKALSRSKLESTLKSIGPEKLKVLFKKDELEFLRDMVQVSKLREPVRGTALGKGPTAQAISKLEERLKKIPILGGIVDAIDIDTQGRAVLKASPKRKALPQAPSPVGAIGGVAGASLAQPEQ